ncbi:MAG: hypothetical protein WBO48_21245 [Candidatus Promineifilaceae bacterium]
MVIALPGGFPFLLRPAVKQPVRFAAPGEETWQQDVTVIHDGFISHLLKKLGNL